MKKPRQTLKEGDKENSKDKRHFKRVSEPVGLGILLRRSLFSVAKLAVTKTKAVRFSSSVMRRRRRRRVGAKRPPTAPSRRPDRHRREVRMDNKVRNVGGGKLQICDPCRYEVHSHPMSRGSSSDGGGSAKTPLQHFSKHYCSNSPHFEVVDNVCLIELLCKSQRLPRRAQDEEITIWARHSGFPRTTLSQCEHMWHRQRQTTW